MKTHPNLRPMRNLLWVLLLFIGGSSCRFKSSKEVEKKSANPKIRNGIVVNPKGVEVEQAFLTYEDGNLVADENKIKLNEKVKLHLVTHGWEPKDSLFFLSGSEIVETSEKDTLLNEKDLFKDFEKGLSQEQLESVTISVTITQMTKLFDYFKVSFKMKDEVNPRHVVEGYYKLHLH